MTSRMISAGFLLVMLISWKSRSTSANENVYADSVHSTVYIVTTETCGSGVLVDRDQRLVITNAHVVGNSTQVTVFFPIELQGQIECDASYYHRHADKVGFQGQVKATDPLRDLALVQLDAVPDTARSIAFGEPARPGQLVHSIGNPGSSDALWIYTAGYVRANYYKRLDDNRMQVVETSSPVNPGDSGGPILDDAGKLIGLTQSYMVESRLVSNGVDITEITWFLRKNLGSVPADGSSASPDADSSAEQPASAGLLDLFSTSKIVASSPNR